MRTHSRDCLGSESTTNRAWLWLLAMFAVVLSVYSTAPTGGFVWDDHTLILQDPSVTTLQPAHRYFTRLFFQDANQDLTRIFYRPLVTLSFAVDYRIWGPNPAGFHLTNLALHLCCCTLLFGLACIMGAGPRIAFAAGVVWGLFPRLTEAVTWISGRTDLLAAAFVLGALVVYFAPSGRRLHHRAIAAMLLLFGLLSKEVALAGFAALLVFESVEQRNRSGSFANWVRATAPLLLAISAYGALRVGVALSAPRSGGIFRLSLMERAALAFEAIGTYARMLVNPWHPQTQIGVVGLDNPALIAAGAVVFCGLATLVVLWWLRSPPPLAIALVTLFLSSLLPVLHLVPLPLNVVAADRFLYLPTASLALLGAFYLRNRAGNPLPLAMAAALAAGFAPVVLSRNNDWASDLSLWAQAVNDVSHENTLPFDKLGHALLERYRPIEALAAFERALESDRAFAERRGISPTEGSLRGVGLARMALGDYEAARTAFQRLASSYPDDAAAAYNLAVAEAAALRFGPARAALARARSLDATFPLIEELEREIDRAENELERLGAPTVDEAPANKLERAALSIRLGRVSEARTLCQQIVDRTAAPPGIREEALRLLARLQPRLD